MPERPIDPADAESLREISFGKAPVDPDDAKAYYARIAAAKSRAPSLASLKGNTPVGVVERPRMPLLAQPQGGASGLTPEGGVAPRPVGSPILSQETIESMEAMQRAKKQAIGEEKAEEEKKLDEEKKEELLEMFDIAGMNEAERILNNKKRRTEIESRCEPMDFEDLLMKDEVQQAIPIIPDRFVIVLRSLRPEDSLFMKQFLSKETNSSDTYAMERLMLCQLTCSLVSINGKDLPDYRKGPDLTPDEALFLAKLKLLTKKSAYIIADMSLNYSWFDMRVRKLIVPEKLGNG